MKKLRTFFGKLGWGKTRIRQQMYTVYALALLLPLTVMGVILMFTAKDMLYDHYMELLESDNRRVKTLLTEVANQAYSIAEDVCFDNGLKTVLTADYETGLDYVTAVNSYDRLDTLVYNAKEIDSVCIYSDNPAVRNYKQFHSVTEEVAASDWYQKAIANAAPFWTSIEGEDSYSSDNSNLCVVRQVTLTDSPYHAVIVVRISDNYIRTRVDSSSIIDAVSVDNRGIVYSSKRGWYGEDQPLEIDYSQNYFRYSGAVEVDGTQYFATVSTVNLYMTSSKLYVATLTSSGFSTINGVITSWMTILLLALLIPGVILTVFAEYFVRRVNLLREEMHKARLRDYNITPDFGGSDELSQAFEDLQFMVQEIKAKDAKMYEAELNEKELRNKQQLMEYKMLAHQINPHYLYNTLETIRMKALTIGDREVADAIKILGKTLHYVLENTGTSLTTLEKELDHVINYLTIQKMRFGDRINYTLEIQQDLDTRAYTVLPLLLQPVVENAVVHGLEDINGAGEIRIGIRREENHLYITVSDSGKGMTGEELERIHTMLATPERQPQSSIALYNINQRIRLRYGGEYGVTLDSRLGQGTEVTLTLPAYSPEISA